MPALLFEIGCEELPASACREAERQLPELCRARLGAAPARLFVGPRRLAFLVEDLPERDVAEERRGPAERVAFADGKPTKAAEGFARGQGVRVEDLVRRDGYVWARVPGEEIRSTLAERLREIVAGLSFSKSMRWDASGLRFSRPVRRLCAKLDGETVSGMHGTSAGHRFAAGDVEIPSAVEYADALRAAGVEPDAEERRRAIVAGLEAIGAWGDPGGVLEEVVYLVESPIVLAGRFDERFLALPERVIVTAMQAHQRYFPLGGARFAFVANGGDPDVVRAGNERVLEGRLEDASFTFERDVARGIDALAAELGSITFVAGAGTFADKATRLERLVEALGGGDASREAARLGKADQAAELVQEFPDLEGYIGAEYARLAGYPEAVCAAIEEHYLPDAAGGPLPQTEAGKVLAAADKSDTLNVAFALGHRPTGSRDPYGLRRAAIGLCRLATEGGVAIPLDLLDPEPREFVEERFESLLELPVEFVRAARGALVRDLGQVADLARTLAALDDERLERLHTVYTRADRIVAKAGDRDGAELRAELLAEPAEREVFEARARAEGALAAAASFDDAVAAAEELAEPLERFFQDVLVMAEDRDLRRNRLRLLEEVRDLIGASLGDLSQIPR